MSPQNRKAPKTLLLGTFNLLRDRPDRQARGDIMAILDDNPRLQGVATQEARDYADVLDRIPGWRYFTKHTPRGADQNGWLVREDIVARSARAIDLGGDGWTTTTGHHHIGSVAMGIVLSDWLGAVSVHLPPSIDWKGGHPVGPDERVDDYIANMKRLVRLAKRAKDLGRVKVTDVKQHDRYDSDHHFVTFKVQAPASGKKGLLYVGDWNNRPGRDDGQYSVKWMAEHAGLRIHQAENAGGRGMWGIDYPVAS